MLPWKIVVNQSGFCFCYIERKFAKSHLLFGSFFVQLQGLKFLENMEMVLKQLEVKFEPWDKTC